MIFRKALFIYKLYMVLYLLAAFNVFFNSGVLLKGATVIAAVFGAGLLLCILFRWKRYRKMKNFFLCILFLISYVISALLNMRYGIVENIQALLWLTCQMGILYIAGFEYSAEEMKQELGILGVVYIVWCTIANLMSLSMIFWGFEYRYVDSQNRVHWIGYLRGRLWGVYDDPNHGAVITVIAVFLMLYLWRTANKKRQKVCMVIGIVVNVLYMGFSNSRTAMIAVGSGLLCWSFLYLRQKKKTVMRAVIISMGISILTVGGLAAFEKVNAQVYRWSAGQNSERAKNTSKKRPNERKKELAKDSSNGRIDIWNSGLEIVKTTPVYGTSFRNMVSYSKKNLPETYIVNNELVDYDSLHNMFLDVLVSQGVIGIILTLLLIGNTIRTLWKGRPHVRESEYDIMIFGFTIIAAMTAASQFYSYLFYLHAPQTFFFWLCMGYIVTIAQRSSETIETGKTAEV